VPPGARRALRCVLNLSRRRQPQSNRYELPGAVSPAPLEP